MTPVQRVLVASLFAAFGVARWISVHSEHLLTPPQLILLATVYVSLGAAASGLAVVALRLWIRPKFVLRPAVVAGALTVPAALLLYSYSRWALVPAITGAWIIGATIRSHALQPVGVPVATSPSWIISPPMGGFWTARVRAALGSAMLLQAGMCFNIVHEIGLATFACSLGITVLISAPEQFPRPRQMRTFNLVTLLVVAFLMTGVALFPHIWFARVPEGWNFLSQQPYQDAPGEAATGTAEKDEHVYQGIIIYPEEEKHTVLVPPLPSMSLHAGVRPSSPLNIPFFGVYWLYRPPHRRPPPKSLVIRANPAKRNLTSTDFVRLNMEARQNFGTYIDLASCRQIQVVAQSEEAMPGTVSLELQILDSAQKLLPPCSLGRVVVPEPEKSAPVTMSFDLPQSLPIKRFDEVVAVFHMARVRAYKAAKVGIQRFVLQPRTTAGIAEHQRRK